MVKEQLEEMLAEMQAMEALPHYRSNEAKAMGDEWPTKHKEYSEFYKIAAEIALLSLPPNIRDLLLAIQRRGWELTGVIEEQ